MSKFFLLIGTAAVLLYGASAFWGWELGNPTRTVVTSPDVRQSRGYRTFFWHSGYHGGK